MGGDGNEAVGGPAPLPKLTYFDVRGLAETVRYMFAVAKQPYEDERLSISLDFKDGKPDFSTIKRPEFDEAKAAGKLDAGCGKVPILTVNGKDQFGQSKAIERYLARKLGLGGSSDEEFSQIDAVAETVRDIKDNYQKAKGEPETKEKFFAEDMPGAMALLEKSLPAGSGPWLIGSSISYADITVYNFVTGPKGFFDDADRAKASYSACPRISAAMAAVDANAELQAYIAGRKDTML
jgi:glutathione S-transferase